MSALRTGTYESFDYRLMQGRWLIILAVIATLLLDPTIEFSRRPVAIVLLFATIYNTVLFVRLNRGPISASIRNLSAAIDLVIVTLIIFFSHGIESPFFGIFYPLLIAFGVQRGLRGAVGAAFTSSLLVLFAESITEKGKLRIQGIDQVFSTIPYLFFVAIASGLLARQLSTEAERRRLAEMQAKEAEVENDRAKREMELARAVQAALLPVGLPLFPGLECAAKTVQSREIGGDLYDLDQRVEGSLTVSIVDVSGKGIPAALAMSGLKTRLDGVRDLKLPDMLAQLNIHMIERTPDYMFATMAICDVHPDKHRLRISSAGHEPVLIIRGADGSIEMIAPGELPLGVSSDVEYSLIEKSLSHGDLIVLYTDGVTDAICGEHDLGLKGISEIVAHYRAKSPQEILDTVFDTLQNECLLKDDATLIIMKLLIDQSVVKNR